MIYIISLLYFMILWLRCISLEENWEIDTLHLGYEEDVSPTANVLPLTEEKASVASCSSADSGLPSQQGRSPRRILTPRPLRTNPATIDAQREPFSPSRGRTYIGPTPTSEPPQPDRVPGQYQYDSAIPADFSSNQVRLNPSSSENEDDADESEESEEYYDGTTSKKKPQRFFCTEYPPCNLSFTRSEHLARHIRYNTRLLIQGLTTLY